MIRYTEIKENKAIDIKTGGKESLRDGKSLHLSGHVRAVEYNGVGPNIPYCIVKATVIRETNLTDTPYKNWIIVHKEKGLIVESYCSCPAGLRGTCKHIAAICHFIIEKVSLGENKAVTQQPQVWHAPSKKIHKAEFLKDIHIQKIQGNCAIEDEFPRSNRFSYDPRAPEERQQCTIYDWNRDEFHQASNGKVGVLCYLPPLPDDDHQDACMEDYSVVNEVIITPAETTEEISVSLPPTLPEIASSIEEEYVFEALTKPLSREVINAVSDATKAQANSDCWFDFRTGRITASKLHQVSKKVNESGDISERNDSLIKQVMNYSPAAYSPAIHWGKYNEEFAVQKFFRLNRRKHRKMEIKQCGVILWEMNPVIAASPDAIVSCSCCGIAPLEVKNPYKYRGLSINKFAEQDDTCLEITGCGEVKLKPNHPYYYQVQAQIMAAKADMGYFALKTASPYNNFHCEQILFDPMMLEDVIDKAMCVFKAVILPELVHGHLKKEIDKGKEKEYSQGSNHSTTSAVEMQTSNAYQVPQATVSTSSPALDVSQATGSTSSPALDVSQSTGSTSSPALDVSQSTVSTSSPALDPKAAGSTSSPALDIPQATVSTSSPALDPKATVSTLSSAIEFPCNICHAECINEPQLFDEMSIYCDMCNKWYHWVCVKVTGTESFLKRRKMKWFCPICKQK